MRRLSPFVLALAPVLLISAFLAAAPRQEGAVQTAPRRIPGINAPDEFPRGCVDCHVNRPEAGMDVRLSTLVREWQAGVAPEFLARVRAFAPAGMSLRGVHPEMEDDVARVRIPSACLTCHSRTSSDAPPFSRLLHGLHLTGAENHFLALFQGECTHCHKLDSATGSWSIGNGSEVE